MSEFLSWRDDWLLNIEMLDTGHRAMVRQINCLADPADPSPLSLRLGGLIVLLKGHFVIEQRFLREIEYPDMDDHAREHALQMAEFADLRRSLATSSAGRLDDGELQAIKDWFFHHVVTEDRRFAAYYREVVCGN